MVHRDIGEGRFTARRSNSQSMTHDAFPRWMLPISPAFMQSNVNGRTVAQLGLAATFALLLAGCGTVPVWQQGPVSKPNMVFNDRGAFVYGPRLNAQIESGSADNGGAAAAGCTACKCSGRCAIFLMREC